MAEEILFGIAEEILLKLGEQAVKQISQIWRVKAELLKLSKTVSTIQAVLLDAEEKKANNQVKNWLERLEDAVYDADNGVDEFRYAQLRRRLVFGNKRAKKVLPDSITRLHHLETLILARCDALARLPQDTKKLVNLRHLELIGCSMLTHMPRRIGELTSLRTLTKFVVANDNNEQQSRQSAGLGELSGLKNLHGELSIILRHIKNVVLELKDAPLKDKEHVHELNLSWNRDEVKSKENHEMVLDRLQPSQTLKALNVQGYMGLRFSDWLSFLTNLVSLELFQCENLQYIPHLHCLSSLEKLEIWGCDAMEYISEMDEDEFCASTMSFLPSLKQLDISRCRSLKGWWRNMKSGDSALTPMPLQETIISSASSSSTPSKLSNLEVDKMISRGDFSSLQSVKIRYCPNLASLPKIIFNVPSLQEVNDRPRNEFGSPDEIEAFLLTH